MPLFRTPEALLAVGALRQYLDSIKPHDRETANMVHEFEEVFTEGEPDAFVPASTGTFSKSQLLRERDALAAEDGIATLSPTDKYSTRRGPNHWTRRRPTQGPTQKLDDDQARAIFVAYYIDKTRVEDLRIQYGVTSSTVYGILRRKTHKAATAALAGVVEREVS